MTRRSFLKSTATAASALLLDEAAPSAQALQATKPGGKLRGVNLGGWLVLEKWITPSLFAGVAADDEYSFCQTLGKAKATDLLKRHRETWITADDFKWMAARGLNAVRLPVGYWVAEENPPFIRGLETLDWAFRTAKANGLGVLLDLHGVPGSQNGFDHSGRQGTVGWPTSKEHIAHSLRVVEDLAERCKGYDNLIGLELLNEPRWDVPIDIIKGYYRDAYPLVRKHLGKERAAVVIHDAFRPMEWTDFMKEPDYSNIILDTHLYQCFTDEDRKRDIYAQVEVAVLERKRLLDKMRQELGCMVGEWSCGMPPESLKGLDHFQTDVGMRAFAAAQLVSYETTQGWFFWTYKTEAEGGWNFRDCVKKGWLPEKFN